MDLRRLTTACAATTAAAAAVVLTAGTAAAATVETVHPSDLGDVWHTADTRPGGTLEWSDDYNSLHGNSAVVLSTPDSAAKVQLFTEAHDGTRLADITEVSYRTYQAVAPEKSVALPAINMRVDTDADGDVDTYLVYEPYQDYGNDAVQAGTWQTWDAWRDGQSRWWGSHLAECPQSAPCTVDELLEIHPDAVIREDGTSLRAGSTPADADFNGSFGLNQGSGNAGVVRAADGLHLATRTGVDVTYDFEPDVRLESKQECKDGGWATSTLPEFRNQGACVSHFPTAR